MLHTGSAAKLWCFHNPTSQLWEPTAREDVFRLKNSWEVGKKG